MYTTYMEQVSAILPATKKRLTLKQKTFTREYVKNGGNATQAALQAYDADYNSAGVIASHNLDNPAILQAIDNLLKERGLNTDDYIADKLTQALEAGLGVKATNKDALQALNMLLKVKNSYGTGIKKTMHLSLTGNLASEQVSSVIETLKKSQQKTNELIEDIS